MTITFQSRATCSVCGARVRGIRVQGFRINRRSMRSTSPGLSFRDPRCHECGFETASAPNIIALTSESQAEVDAYRERRWPAA